MPWATLLRSLCARCCLGIDRVRPRITKSKLRGSFLGVEFAGCFNDRAQRITQLTGIFAVGMVNPPKLVAWLLNRALVHASSSPQSFVMVVYQLHHMHAQSG
jgi:hypothetical protein